MAANSVALRDNLAQQLSREAERQETSIEDLVNDWLEEYLWEQAGERAKIERQARRDKIRQENQAYYAMHDQLKKTYRGQHVAIHEGQLVDHDPDPMALVRRVRQRFGRAPVLITPVQDQPYQEFTIRSPRLAS